MVMQAGVHHHDNAVLGWGNHIPPPPTGAEKPFQIGTFSEGI